ncbi:BTB/POZ domain containing protein [Acanthamoeba castellanii str. Neff]|uniref:BTB/POZ domain containing protein n=1 Tax=Acanthamoeba castellanii (strain ATCC 30010 / Neff) TaxID=1257118 RepID=L8H0Z9_ACACF|nr:BTB/POZ domain containing protein [Acanthamoeba castellanii str. Neff]ELR19149.1 BTB/POZ domain containing protein [Acanthamoeba castellanii str. Neff]
MVDNPLCADVQLLVGQEATPVYASKVILMARSPVFEALLGGNFREGQPPPSSSSSASSSLAPVFWHRAEIRDVEPRTMRHLLHSLYTDQLHPDFLSPAPYSDDGNNDSTAPTQQQQDLVALYMAADCYLVDKVRALVRRELGRSFDDDDANVLPVFDMVLAVAPELAMHVCQPIIETHAWSLLGNQHAYLEALWLGLSDTAAARVVRMNLRGIGEIELFGAIQRRYEHHLAEAMELVEDDEDDDCEKGQENGDDKKMMKKREAAIAEAKNKVAGLIEGIKTSLMSVDELCSVVEPSGLFTDAQLLAAYRHAALNHRYVIHDLWCGYSLFNGQVEDGNIRWRLAVCRTPTSRTPTSWTVDFRIRTDRADPHSTDSLSAEGVTITIYCDRRCVKSFWAPATTVVTMPDRLSVPFTMQPHTGRVTIFVHAPPTAFTQAGPI